MKTLQVAHAIVTGLLLIAVLGFLALLALGQIEVRLRADRGTPVPRSPAPVADDRPHVVIIRGLRPNWDFALNEGLTVIGRADEKPVDIDL